MIRFLDILSWLLEWSYVFVFFWTLRTFLPLRSNWPMRLLAFVAASYLACVIVYSNDLASLLGPLLGFIAYVTVCHRGNWTRKLTAVLVFYPAVIAVNYLMMDIGSRLFFRLTGASSDIDMGWTQELLLFSTAVHTASLLLRLLFWVGAWRLLRRYLMQITTGLTVKMWLVIDVLMLAPFVAVFTILYFLPERAIIVYPICGASIFSSFGCIYLAAYICNSVQTAYHAQELERRQAYWNDRLSDEERVRSIYHDMKNHLLVLQSQAGNAQEIDRAIQTLREQIEDYETYYHTGNEFLDIIIRDKARAAKEKQIDFNAVIQFEDGGFITPLDISTLFGNALDNALEASEKLPEQQRLITVKASRVRDMLVIAVENNRQPQAGTDIRTSKQDTLFHGFGISNIKKTAEKYDGQCAVQPQSDKFILKIVLPIPE